MIISFWTTSLHSLSLSHSLNPRSNNASHMVSRFGINKWYQSFALRNFDLEDMELESTNSGPIAKLPILKLVPQTTQENDLTVTKMSTPATAEEKTNKKNDVKGRGLLLKALPNEHQLTFSQYPDAKSMFAAIETRFGGNAATKKNLLKQQYENFSATKDLNLKILSSLPPEWNTHVVVWMNKPEVETMSIDDLYNNFQIVEQKVKKTVGTSSGGQNLAFMTAPSTSSTNDANTASPQVSAASPSVNVASPQVCTASVSDNTVYTFMVENPNGSNVLHQDLEKIHEDDLEAMDLKWQLSLLSVKAKKAPRSKEGQFKNQDNTRKQGNNEETSSKAMLAIEGVGFDWSDMAEEQVQTNMALMVFSDSVINCHNHQRRGIVSRNNYNRVDAKNTHPSVLRNMSPKAVLLKTGLTPLNTVKLVNTAHPKIAVHSAKSKTHFLKQAQSTTKGPFYKQTALTRRFVHSAKRHYYAGRHNIANTARSYTGQVNAVRVKDGLNNENAKQERFTDDSSTKDVNAAGQHINTASPDVNTGSLKLNAVEHSLVIMLV
ncbi:hypothetical protein Tco_0316425 [Tanacetum coccineum]